MQLIKKNIGQNAFRLDKGINKAFDAVSLGIALCVKTII